jgi:hypothetical protein
VNPDIRWKQRFQNFDRGFALLREVLERSPETLSMLEKEGVIRRFESRKSKNRSQLSEHPLIVRTRHF